MVMVGTEQSLGTKQANQVTCDLAHWVKNHPITNNDDFERSSRPISTRVSKMIRDIASMITE